MMVVCPSFSGMYEPNVEIRQFPDGDSYVRVPQAQQMRGKNVVVFNRLYPDQDSALFQTILVARALKGEKARSITLVAPYLPYSRQDKTFKDGEVKSAEILCELLRDAGIGHLITFDCHFLKREGEFEYGGLRITNLSMNREIVDKAREIAGEDLEIMSPDEGANYLVKEFGGSSMKKVRGEYSKGSESAGGRSGVGEGGGAKPEGECGCCGEGEIYRGIEKMEMKADVRGKSVLIIDDMVSTGSTMLKAIENVKRGGAKKVICAATHGFFLKDSLKKLRGECEKVFVTNTIETEASEISIKGAIEKALEQME
jgi:ribose-phosphate pyrophosphokinase